MSVNVREAALNSLLRCEKDGRYSNIELDGAIKKYALEGVDRAFFTTLVYGVIEKRITLDYALSIYSSRPPETLDPFILNILRLAAYQIYYLDRTPDSAAVNEAVESAKRRANVGAAGYCNAVLRKLAADSENIPCPDRSEGLVYWSVKYSLPKWLCEMWLNSYGERDARSIMENVNRRAKAALFVNTLKTTRQALIERLGGLAECVAEAPNGVILKKDIPISDLPIGEGDCFVQDISAQLCVKVLSPAAGETVIDTCACPGGKSFAAAIAMGNEGRIISLDLHQNKLSLIRSGAERLGINIIETACHDGTEAKAELIGIADRVICDVPCSGLGVIAKKPDLRYKTPDDLARMPDLQLKILTAASKYLKYGGSLVYSTCTVNRAENAGVAKRFAELNPNFHPTEQRVIYPAEDRDGFFYTIFKRY